MTSRHRSNRPRTCPGIEFASSSARGIQLYSAREPDGSPRTPSLEDEDPSRRPCGRRLVAAPYGGILRGPVAPKASLPFRACARKASLRRSTRNARLRGASPPPLVLCGGVRRRMGGGWGSRKCRASKSAKSPRILGDSARGAALFDGRLCGRRATVARELTFVRCTARSKVARCGRLV